MLDTQRGGDPFEEGDFIGLLRRKPVISMTDYDGTRTEKAYGPVTLQAAADCAAARKFEEEQELVTGALSARPLPFMMTQQEYDASVAMGFTQLPPKWFKKGDIYVPGDWCQDPFFDNCTSTHVIGSLGGGLGVKRGGGYLVDREYEQLLMYDHLQDAQQAARTGEDALLDFTAEPGPMSWYTGVREFVYTHCPDAVRFMPQFEFMQKYLAGGANSPPQIARIQFTGTGPEALEVFAQVLQAVADQRRAGNRLAYRINPTNEDKVDLFDSDKTVYTLYLLPWFARKQKMFNRLLARMAKAAGLSTRDLLVFYAGDTVTDLYTSLWGGGNARVVALLATNSRLTPAILGRWQYYGMEYLGKLWKNPAKGRHEDRIQPTEWPGVFRVVHRVARGTMSNYLVLGDLRYPNETAPGSVRCFLEEFVPKTPHWGNHGKAWWDKS